MQIELIIRGICCLRPGMPGGLGEHPGDQHHRQIPRALADRRISRMAMSRKSFSPRPTGCRATSAVASRSCSRSKNPSSERRIVDGILGVVLADNVKARELQADGTYRRVAPAKPGEPSIRSQVEFQNMALELCETSPISHPAAAMGATVG